jgi:pimeloyl-ACP methyl ester carboxylesterase
LFSGGCSDCAIHLGGAKDVRFVLIHGGFHGAWCWSRTIPELEKLGHDAVAIDIPGHGQRVMKRPRWSGVLTRSLRCWNRATSSSDTQVAAWKSRGRLIPHQAPSRT